MTPPVKCRIVATGLLLLSLAGCGEAQGFSVDSAWGYAPVVSNGTAVAYLTIENRSREPLTLTAFHSPDFGLVTLHETSNRRGMVHMQPLERYAIAPGKTLEMRPGGIHLMLMSPRKEISAGHRGKLVIGFADGRSAKVKLTFRGRESAPAASIP